MKFINCAFEKVVNRDLFLFKLNCINGNIPTIVSQLTSELIIVTNLLSNSILYVRNIDCMNPITRSTLPMEL